MHHISPSSLMLRRFCFLATPSFSSSAAAFSTSAATINPHSSTKKKLVFLGSPSVSASVLETLLDASSASDSLFEVAAIVTQPPSGRDRGRKVLPSPVAQHALHRGFPADLIFTPVKASEVGALFPLSAHNIIQLMFKIFFSSMTKCRRWPPTVNASRGHPLKQFGTKVREAFLSDFSALEPELCITAAYGNILPTKFLKIPSLGTVNIHPSLLPLYRGAAPVQRALQDGVKETGVSLAFTVRALDAGPIIASEKMEIDEHIKAPELLDLLFAQGSKLLLQELPSILDGSASTKAEAQDDSKATLAPKISQEESWLSFDQEASMLHNKVGLEPELDFL